MFGEVDLEVGEGEIQGIDDNVSVRDVIEDEGQSDEAVVDENVSDDDEEEVVFEKLLNIEREMEYV